jgi:hypothetical protein
MGAELIHVDRQMGGHHEANTLIIFTLFLYMVDISTYSVITTCDKQKPQILELYFVGIKQSHSESTFVSLKQKWGMRQKSSGWQ